MAYGKIKRTDTTGQVQEWGGIATGTIEAWADELGCDPEDVPPRLHDAGEVVMDTADRKSDHYDDDRPTDPELRSIAVIPENGLLDDEQH